MVEGLSVPYSRILTMCSSDHRECEQSPTHVPQVRVLMKVPILNRGLEHGQLQAENSRQRPATPSTNTESALTAQRL